MGKSKSRQTNKEVIVEETPSANESVPEEIDDQEEIVEEILAIQESSSSVSGVSVTLVNCEDASQIFGRVVRTLRDANIRPKVIRLEF